MIDQILFALAFFVLGAVSGVLVNNLWQNRRKGAEKPSAEAGVIASEAVEAAPVDPALKNAHKEEPGKKKQKKALLLEDKMPKDMLEEINEILQDLVLASSLKGKKLKVAADPPFGVAVWVDGVKHTGVDQVEDDKIKQLLKQSIADWEARVIARSENR